MNISHYYPFPPKNWWDWCWGKCKNGVWASCVHEITVFLYIMHACNSLKSWSLSESLSFRRNQNPSATLGNPSIFLLRNAEGMWGITEIGFGELWRIQGRSHFSFFSLKYVHKINGILIMVACEFLFAKVKLMNLSLPAYSSLPPCANLFQWHFWLLKTGINIFNFKKIVAGCKLRNWRNVCYITVNCRHQNLMLE